MKALSLTRLNTILIVLMVSFIPQHSVKGANYFNEQQNENSNIHECSIIKTKYINGQYIAIVNLSEVEIVAERNEIEETKSTNGQNPLLVVFLPCIEITAFVADKSNDTAYLMDYQH